MYHLLREFGKHHEVRLVALSDDLVSENDRKEIEDIISEVDIFYLSPVRKYASIFKGIFSLIPFQVSLFYDRSVHRKIKEIVKEWAPDHVFFQLARMATYAQGIDVPKTLDYMDAFGVGMQRRAKIERGLKSGFYSMEARRMIDFEKRIYGDFDHHTIISGQDAGFLDVSGGLTIVPNGIDTSYFYPRVRDKKYQIGFIGNMGYLPNVDAVEYLIHMIKPMLPGNYKYLISGARPDHRVKALASDRVEVSGWVDDIRDAYASIEILVAPLWKGTGQQNKILEAMAMGIPCVTTPAVNAAIGGTHMENIMLADDVDSFAGCITTILSDGELYQKVASNALDFVMQKYQWAHSADIYDEMWRIHKG